MSHVVLSTSWLHCIKPSKVYSSTWIGVFLIRAIKADTVVAQTRTN